MTARAAGRETVHWSTKQLRKQREIIDAAKRVLAEQGLAACTARAVADASPLTKSAIHYYFDDMDKIIDLAMASHIDAFVDRLRLAANTRRAPAPRFWAVVREYLDIFVEMPYGATLWFAYWSEVVKDAHRLRPIQDMQSHVLTLFEELLSEIGVDNPEGRSHALLSYLMGTIVQQAITPVDFSVLKKEIAALCGLPPGALAAGSARRMAG